MYINLLLQTFIKGFYAVAITYTLVLGGLDCNDRAWEGRLAIVESGWNGDGSFIGMQKTHGDKNTYHVNDDNGDD